jgi:hypothetical protein
VKTVDAKFKTQVKIAKTPYDGISPEVFEKNGSEETPGTRCGVKTVDAKFKTQDEIAKTPYDGISPEVFEKNEPGAREFAIGQRKHMRLLR